MRANKLAEDGRDPLLKRAGGEGLVAQSRGDEVRVPDGVHLAREYGQRGDRLPGRTLQCDVVLRLLPHHAEYVAQEGDAWLYERRFAGVEGRTERVHDKEAEHDGNRDGGWRRRRHQRPETARRDGGHRTRCAVGGHG